MFDNPKDHEVLARLFNYCIQSESEIILDFFAGSSSTAEAVFQVNVENKTKHRFILVQLPELTSAKSNASKKGFSTISDVSKERIRKVIQKQLDANSHLSLLDEEKPDLGFKVFRLSN